MSQQSHHALIEHKIDQDNSDYNMYQNPMDEDLHISAPLNDIETLIH